MRGPAHGLGPLVDIGAAVYNRIRGKEQVYRGVLEPENCGAFELLEDAEGSIDVEGTHPHTGNSVSESVGSETAAQMFLDVENNIDLENYTIRTNIEYRRGGDLNFKVAQNDDRFSAPYEDFLSYEGTLETGVEKEDVREALEPYGIGRYASGWEFDIDDGLEEF